MSPSRSGGTLTSRCVVPASRLRTSAGAPSPWNAASLAPSGGAAPARLVLVPASAAVRALRRRASASAEYPKPKQKSRISRPPPRRRPRDRRRRSVPATKADQPPAYAALPASRLFLDGLLHEIVGDDGRLEVGDRDLAVAAVEVVDHAPPLLAVRALGGGNVLPQVGAARPGGSRRRRDSTCGCSRDWSARSTTSCGRWRRPRRGSCPAAA